MVEYSKHTTGKWEVSIIAFHEPEGIRFKVTRRLPGLSVAETKVFSSEEDARNQFNEWIR